MKRKFNKSQEKAVMWKNGPCLVLAGPGSGKTFVLTSRIYELINSNIDPKSILVITFTRASANEMKERFLKFLVDDRKHIVDMPTFGTFHSVFYEILRSDFGYTNESLINEQDQIRILYSILEKFDEVKVSPDSVSNILSDISSYRMSLEKETIFTPRYVSKTLFDKLYKAYTDRLFNEKKLDFYDMIDKCYSLLKEHQEVLSEYQERYQYILIDEFQDINKSQYDLIKLIGKSHNIFVVGDDDQSIYKFRGSHPKVMRDFLKDNKNVEIIKLNENYRCARVIVKFSKLIIDKNVDRFDKDLVAKRDDVGKLFIKAFIDSKQENEYIIDNIRKYQKIGIKLSEMAILYRTNLLSSVVIKELNKYNIPYRVLGENINIYDNFAIKDIISYLRVAIGSTSSEDYMRIANKPLRYISRDAIGHKSITIDKIIKYYSDKDYMLDHLSKLSHDIKVIGKTITPLAIRYIRENVGYDDYLIRYCKEKGIESESILELLDSFEEESIGHNDIAEYLKYIESESNKEHPDNSIVDSISLMTFHLSKGLEFKVVFIIDANDMIIPHKKSIKEGDIETERRLFYVGMTRAKDFLHILFTKKRLGKNYRASRFILEAVGGNNG